MVLSDIASVQPTLFAGKSISEEILEQINCEVIFRIPIPGVSGGIPVYESTIITWLIMAVVTVLCALATRNLKLVPDKKQLVLEAAVGWIRNFCRENMGEGGMRYFPYLGTVLIYIGVSNVIGLIGLKPPTKDLSVTMALALMSICLIEGANFRHRGVKGFFKSLLKPTPVMLPMNILEIGIRPLSLCLRLFGNVVAAFIIMELLKIVCPVVLPLPFSLYFDIFDGCLQAYIFVFLTSLFIHESIEDEE
ncbi:F-type H+-transporting ATPase subunit a [Ruminococcus sp. YE71]|uniref:F0F1 ATP synthase subunit A n=1 Tax=unclassified Ruminococcus TaxID=2608920 RepID=UPI000886F8FB|nr:MULTISPECIES: F0F1 ATP synthase subunit A [unclassified Ruminococcus]SDA12290.1 F-type H+-transporting ATPase subunit a [Ruminococcus sp. YE78]SFW16700.1 F-type H+-transporting ATPase subunit a [Ruminococcus sp. YE71]